MICKLDKKYDNTKTIILFAVMAALFGALISLVSFLAVPPTVAFLAVLLIFSFPKKEGILLCAAASIGICALAFFAGAIELLAALIAVILGLSIGIMYMYGRSKPERVVVTTVLIIVAFLTALWIGAGSATGNYEFSSVREFYADIYADLKVTVIETMRKNYASLSETLANEELEALLAEMNVYLDNLLFLLPSIAVIFALIIAGFSFKIFGVLVCKYSSSPVYILKWRFLTSNVFVLAYIVLAIMNIFVSGTEIFALTVANIYSILNFVFAYIGYNFVTALLTAKMRLGFARFVVILAVLMLSSFALQVLAIGGVIFTFLCNKAGSMPTDASAGGSDNGQNESENDNEKQ